MAYGQSKHHEGRCSWAFDRYTAGKCKVCGEYKKWRMRCAFPICNKNFSMNHICGKPNDIFGGF